MKIGVFGGSFNPIHNMHLKITENLLKKKYVDKIIFVPTGDHYSYKTHMISGKSRLEMIKLAIKETANLSVSNFELKEKMIYTYETLNHFKNTYPTDQIYFICGTDNLNYLNTWKHPEEIQKFPILVIERNNEKINSKFLNQKNITCIPIKTSALSSSLIREKIKNGEDITGLVPKKVQEYIQEKKLYRKD